MISFLMIVIDVGSDRSPKVLFTKRDDPAEALSSEAADPSFRVGIGTHSQVHLIRALRSKLSE